MLLFSRWVLLVLALVTASSAEVLKIGDAVPGFTAKDQHGEKFEFKPGPRVLLVSLDMSTGKKANTYFAAREPGYLDKAKAVYLSNIHGMPAIGRVFALPKMRKYPHRIVLADDEGLLAPMPRKNGLVTALLLDPSARITSVQFWDAEKQTLEEALKASP